MNGKVPAASVTSREMQVKLQEVPRTLTRRAEDEHGDVAECWLSRGHVAGGMQSGRAMGDRPGKLVLPVTQL